jgi:hypothetical protein
LPKVKLANVTGVVAMSYLVLIPVAGYYGWRRFAAMEQDLTTLWDHLEINPKEQAEVIGLPSMERLKRTFRL